MTTRTLRAAGMLITVLLAACGARTTPLAAPRPDTLRSERVAAGVTHEYRWYAAGPWAVHDVTIDARACGIDLRTMKGQDLVVGRETTSSMAEGAARRYNRPALVAVNGDFFSFDPPGVSEGPQISNGTLIKSEGSHREALDDRVVRLRPVFAFTSDEKPVFAHTRLRGSIQTRTVTLPLAGVNVRTRDNAAFIYTTYYGSSTPADTGALELIVRGGAVSAIDTAAAGVGIPADGFVLSAKGTARAGLARIAPGDSIGWSAVFDSLPANVTELIGGYPMLLMRGREVHHDEPGLRAAFSDRRHPRAALGVDRQQRIHVIAVDGRREGYSEGMTLDELADYLLAHGITSALNLDGGGSTTLVVGGRIVNRPTDASGQRPVANALVVLGPPAGECR